ncbi:ABC transporter permease subunit [Enterocloster citroniae]|uniref:ABC transporter permease subunit n=1 Tax=Enterocloster citroniae TaxID=358743 RepID=A0AA41K5A1_9FIRM|nr:sugar ABC transporter permease [Enterocloster citroniae]MBT9810221.1 ABC transporter permease subunit [Enterocloster citroniae]
MRWLSKKQSFVILLAPTLILFTLFVVVPVGIACYYSFTNFTGIGSPTFVGLSNYMTLFKDKVFFLALKNTGIVLGVSAVTVIPLSFLLALLLDRAFPGTKLAKALNFSPNIIAPILVGLIWVFILDPGMGLVNALLRQLGMVSLQPEWIGGRTLTPYSVAFVYLWKVLGYNATIFMAAFKMIPGDIYEAASIDGAGGAKKLWYITIPMIKPTLLIVTILLITGVFKIFEIVVQLTAGGPNHLSELLVTYMYYMTFQSTKYGYGMSIAIVTFLLTAVFAVIYIGVTRERIGEK